MNIKKGIILLMMFLITAIMTGCGLKDIDDVPDSVVDSVEDMHDGVKENIKDTFNSVDEI